MRAVEINVAARIAFALAILAVLLPFAIAAIGAIGDATRTPGGAPSIGDGLGAVFGAVIGLQWACFAAIPAVIAGLVSLARPARRLGIIAICIAVPVAALSVWLRLQF